MEKGGTYFSGFVQIRVNPCKAVRTARIHAWLVLATPWIHTPLHNISIKDLCNAVLQLFV